VYFRDCVCCFTSAKHFLTIWVLITTLGVAALAQSSRPDLQPCQEPKPKSAESVCPSIPASAGASGATAFVVQQPPSPPEGRFSSWVPLFQSGLWVILLAGFLIGFHKEVADLINRIRGVDLGVVKLSTEPEPIEPLSTAEPTATPVEIRFDWGV
jgi:hypothetical protein